MSDALDRLAAHCGIAADYYDLWGQQHATSASTQHALLAAMRVPTGKPAKLLQALEDDDWRHALPPVLVVRVGEPVRVALTLPAESADGQWRWIATFENGDSESGEFRPNALTRLGERVVDARRRLRCELSLPALTQTGYHRLELERVEAESGAAAGMALIVAPVDCYQPEALLGDGRVWGPAVQLYSLRSRRNWGIGDFTDLRLLVEQTADEGGGIVGVNPLHALFADNPAHASPYSPSQRCFLDPHYIDVEAVPEFRECETARERVAAPEFQARLRRLREAELVDYVEVAAVKSEILELLYAHFRERHLGRGSERERAFLRYQAEQGEALERLARFEVLQAHFRAADAGISGWPAWPEEYRDPEASAVAEFAREHADDIIRRAWLQFVADEQLAAVGRRSWQRGLGVGLYEDLAVGAHPDGAEAWSRPDAFADGAHAGAPPDDFNLTGQDWGLLPFSPRRLRELAYRPLIQLLRANMRHAGALRIDHVMGLMRMFWVPAGLIAAEGAYVAYPFDDLLGIVALESRRNRCMVIGEDLGTVPEGLREQLAQAGVLSYRLFLFERDQAGAFKPPTDYPRQALVAVATHDLPTLRGFWKGADLDLRAALDLFPDEAQRDRLLIGRSEERARFLVALEREQLLPADASVHPISVPDITPALAEAMHAFLARTPSQVLTLRPEDVLGVVDQPNLPGTHDDQHPNWRRRLPLAIEDWPEDARFAGVAAAIRQERGGALERRDALLQGREPLIPRATYRLQFHRDFTFADANAIVPYLAELGISHCYASPYLKARPGSSHGYDIVDHAALNPEIGSGEDFERFVDALGQHGMHQIVDMVPNHMGVMGADNAWWLDVLENGPASAYARYFDIDWEPLKLELHGKVLLPLLGDHYGSVLHRGELRLEFDAAHGEFSLFYYHHRLPIDPATYPQIIGHHLDQLASHYERERHVELESLLTAFARLPGRQATSPVHATERRRDKEVHKRHLAALCQANPAIADHVAANVAEFNGRPGDGASFDLLHALIRAQAYRLAYWRVAADEINYRRFFDINELAALRMENDDVFDATHGLVLSLLAEGKIDGMRIDHPDGLADPGRYFRHLQQRAGGRHPTDPPALAIYLVIEKILAEHERLPDDWPIHGATGYRFANLANGLLVAASAERRLKRIYDEFVGRHEDFDETVYRSKRLIMRTLLSSELSVLSSRLSRIAGASRETCDFTLQGLREALMEVAACFPVYRSYVTDAGPSEDDRRHIDWAVAVARKRSTEADVSVFDFVRNVLTLDIAHGRSAAFRDRIRAFALKFQQFSAPAMAKGLEDTALYRDNRLISLNDVGADPRRFSVSVAAYHAATRTRAESWPHNMLATSTHDSKRSEDVRARIDVLSEIPAEWKLMLRRWSRINRGRKREVNGAPAPSNNDEYLFYQSLLGLWPMPAPAPDDAEALEALRARLTQAMIKAVREAKVHSNWLNVDGDYEAALTDFVAALLTPGDKNLFLADFVPFAALVARHGFVNSLSLTLLKLASPGVPDFYQGCELWQFSLMDPDNRRPVDYALRRRLLDEIKRFDDLPADQLPTQLRPLLDDMTDGRVKLHLIRRTLRLRREQEELFRDGDYLPLDVRGQAAEHVCAFARRLGDQALIAIVPRLTVALLADRHTLPCGPDVWTDTIIELPADLAEKSWHNALTDECHAGANTLSLGQALASFPVGLLVAD